MNATIPQPEPNSSRLYGESPHLSLSARLLNTHTSNAPSPHPSFSTTNPLQPIFKRNFNHQNNLHIIVLSKACRIITIQKPCENKIASSSHLNRSESTICRPARANLRFEKYYQQPPRERGSTLGRRLSHIAATPAKLPSASVESGRTTSWPAKRSCSPS
jgi:hypothetical protein